MKKVCRMSSKRRQNFRLLWKQVYGLRCAYCEEDCKSCATVDHLVPKSKGGGNTLDNMVIACLNCNQTKGDKTVEEFKPLVLKPLRS